MKESNGSPVERARQAARTPLGRRVYKQARAAEAQDGFRVLLDEKPLVTPAKAPVILPARRLAQSIAAEWRKQGERIEPATMPLTRLAFTIIDRVARARVAVVDAIVAYAGSDLLCHRAGEPEGLIARQTAAWDPILDWAAEECGIRLAPVAGVMPRTQPTETLNIFRQEIENESDFVLGALADMTALTGSAILALAVLRGRLSVQEGWAAAHVDEDWQIAQWGEDEEAARRRQMRWLDMQAAARLVELLRA